MTVSHLADSKNLSSNYLCPKLLLIKAFRLKQSNPPTLSAQCKDQELAGRKTLSAIKC